MTQTEFTRTMDVVSGRRNPVELHLDITLKPKSSPILSPTSPRITKSINLGFTDISYHVRAGILTREKRQLLKSVSGDFRVGELTAIMGPSGAGKSTLMDILAGFTTSGVSGEVTVNGQRRDLAAFRRASAYIMQEDNLQPLLTVAEAMHVAAELKLTLSRGDKIQRVDEILEALGLAKSRNTRTGELSGGQRKRLAIALELINNPPVMFFDEPTSGLDSVSSKQCIGLLQSLAREGRTIICTIHQPSALIFNMIDHLYVVSNGSCHYTGGTMELVEFLKGLGEPCPISYNLADFLLERITEGGEELVSSFIQDVQNGRCNKWRASTVVGVFNDHGSFGPELFTPVRAPKLPPTPIGKTPPIEKYSKNGTAECSTTFWKQLYVLLKRNIISLSRDKVLTFTRLSMHLLIALLVGTLYFQIGQKAEYAFENYNLLFFSIMFLMFSAFNATIITFPAELPIVMREHFNRWYKLRSFYVASKIADFPVQVIAVMIFTITVYFMSNQILEWRRMAQYITMCTVISLVSQTFGLVLGIIMKVQNGVIFGPLLILPFMIFSGFFVHFSDASPYLQWLFHISFVKYGFEGVMVAIYGYNRTKMPCNEIYCHYRWPKTLLKEVDMSNVDYTFNISILIGLYCVLEIIAYIALRIRLKHRWW